MSEAQAGLEAGTVFHRTGKMKNTERVLRILIHLWALSIFSIGAQGLPKHASADYAVYVGTYTDKESKGIYGFRIDTNTAKVTPLGLLAETENPSFLAADPTGKFLYAVNEIDEYMGQKTGTISAFRIEKSSGKLILLNRVPSEGTGPCYVTTDRTGRYVLIANYGGGSIADFPVLNDGSLGPAASFIQHKGSGPKPNQDAPRAHSIGLSADNRFAVVADLALDSLISYPFDVGNGELTEKDAPEFKLPAGAGPRHFTFDSRGKFAYVLAEMQSAVTAMSFNSATGELRQIQTISTLPKDFSGVNNAAEVQVHPSGKFLYASNRGHDSIAVFAINPKDGTLKLLEFVPTGGKEPRHFGMDSTGRFLIVANQNSGNVVVFKIDSKTGRLASTGQVFAVPTPVAVKFVALD
jgi:6-phosphogluconolactonase